MRLREFINLQPLSKKTFIILGSLALLVVSFSFLVHVRVQQALVGYAIAAQEDTVLELEDRLRQLRLEREVLKRPERIQEKAHEWFRMQYGNE